MLDHTNGVVYTNQMNEDLLAENENIEFNLGKSDNEFDEFPSSESSIGNNGVENFIIETNQTEDREKISKVFTNNKKINSLMNNYYYEFLIHKMVQYDVRKYPDEIIPKGIVFQGKFNHFSNCI